MVTKFFVGIVSAVVVLCGTATPATAGTTTCVSLTTPVNDTVCVPVG